MGTQNKLMENTPKPQDLPVSGIPISSDVGQSPQEAGRADMSEFKFDEPPNLAACTANTCKNGHEWSPVMQLTQCPGCKGAVLAIKMEQCPICNEPGQSLRLRADHLPKGGAITPVCRGSQSLAEINTLVMQYQHFTQEQAKHVIREMPGKI